MRPRMSAGATFSQARRPMMSHISALFAGSSHQRAASMTAAVSASVARGFCCTKSARSARHFSGWSFQNSPVTMAV